jgi:hypothetical protein
MFHWKVTKMRPTTFVSQSIKRYQSGTSEELPMTGSARKIARVILGLSIALSAAAQAPTTAPAAAQLADEEGALHAFAAIHPIDVHVHVFKTDPAFQKMLERLNLKLMDILVTDDTNPHRKHLQQQIDDAEALVRASGGHIALCTTFDPYKFSSASFSADAIRSRLRAGSLGGQDLEEHRNGNQGW